MLAQTQHIQKLRSAQKFSLGSFNEKKSEDGQHDEQDVAGLQLDCLSTA